MGTPRRFRCTAQCGFAARFKTENGLAKKHNWPRHCAVFGRHRERVPRFPLSPHTRDSIVPRSDFVEAIQHFVARPKYYHTQREDQKGSHFSIPPSSRSKLRGGFSVDEFSVELTIRSCLSSYCQSSGSVTQPKVFFSRVYGLRFNQVD